MKTLTSLLALSSVLFAADLYNEPYRLQFHFSPAKTWTNDPNGLVWYKGEYHLFFQNNPFGNKWGHMSWGHAVSTDLLHWKELAVAIPEENGIMIFSGSAVVDRENSSGLCHNPNPSDKSCLVAIYTGHTSTLQTQNIAASNDRGRTWTKYSGNPVIDLHMKDFRDPKVFWDSQRARWVMAVSLPDEHKIRLFGSKNLREWTQLSDFGPAGATGGQWECPDLFPLRADGGAQKWVFIVNINPGGVQGGSATQYFLGDFDGTQFHNANPSSTTLWADWGKDFYAAVTFFNGPQDDNRRIFQGWFGNWEYANDEPTAPQRGAMAFPRELALRNGRLIQTPVRELASLREGAFTAQSHQPSAVNHEIEKAGFRAGEAEIDFQLDLNGAREAGVRVRKSATEATVIGITSDGSAFIDRSRSGNLSFSPKFGGRQTAPLAKRASHRLHILVDRSSVEVFLDDGALVLSDRIFPNSASDGVEFYSTGGEARIRELRAWRLKPIWR